MHPYDNTASQICTKCGTELPATTEYFHRDKRSKQGLASRCKECARAYKQANRERDAQQARIYRARNKERIAKYKRAYRAANQERIAEYQRAYFAKYRVENAERLNQYGYVWRTENRERRAHIRRLYRQTNPERVRAAEQRRRARALRAEGHYTAGDVRTQFERQKGHCYYCGKKVGEIYHVDHIVPLARGGTNWPENLVIACRQCNESKGAKLPHEWPQGGRLL